MYVGPILHAKRSLPLKLVKHLPRALFFTKGSRICLSGQVVAYNQGIFANLRAHMADSRSYLNEPTFVAYLNHRETDSAIRGE